MRMLVCLAFVIIAVAVPTIVLDHSSTDSELSIEQARQMMAEQDGDYILLDVRTLDEFAAGHKYGAILIPHDEIADRFEDEFPDRNALIFVYCRTGRRSAWAVQMIREMGYEHVHDIGGII